jgi:hypothetical protein
VRLLVELALVVAVVAEVRPDFAVPNRPDAGCDPVDKEAVVGDEQDGAIELAQHLLERLPSLDVEVVRRFVEDEEVRLLQQQAGKGKPRALSPESEPTRLKTSSSEKRKRPR